jgi:hypothetical protein
MLDITFCHRPLPVDRRLPAERNAVADLLVEGGHRVDLVTDGPIGLMADRPIGHRPGRVVWLHGSPSWFPTVVRQLAAMPESERPLVVCWHSEPLPPPRAAGLPRPRLHLREVAKILLRDSRATDVYTNHRRLEELARRGLPDLLVVTSRGRQEFLAERGIAAQCVPFGYLPVHGRHLGLDRDIDVLMLGAQEIPRRKRRLRYLRSRGVDVVAKGSWSDPACWGEGRTELLNRTRILVNLQRYAGDVSHLRLIMAGAAKTLLVSEPMYAPEPAVPGEHYVSVTVEEMPDAIGHYLAHEDERRRIVENAYRLVTEEMTAERSVGAIVSLIGQHPKRRSRPDRAAEGGA